MASLKYIVYIVYIIKCYYIEEVYLVVLKCDVEENDL